MSSANVAANASYDMLVNYVFYATAALYLYDRIISIGQEVDCIWRRRNTRIIVPALYVMMHSCAMLYLLLNPLQDIPNCQSYLAFSILQMVTICLMYAVFGAIASLRVYTINGRSWKLPIVVMLLGLTPVATNIYCAARWRMTVFPPFNGCTLAVAWSVATGRWSEILTRSSIVVADALVFLATWRSARGNNGLRQEDHFIVRPRLSSLLLRDGALQFGALFVFNLVIGIFLVKSSGFLGTNFIILEDVVTIILLSRLLFHLRETRPQGPFSSTSESQSSRSTFRDAFKQINAMLHELEAAEPSNDDQEIRDNVDDRMDDNPEVLQDDSDIELSTACTIGSESPDPRHGHLDQGVELDSETYNSART